MEFDRKTSEKILRKQIDSSLNMNIRINTLLGLGFQFCGKLFSYA